MKLTLVRQLFLRESFQIAKRLSAKLCKTTRGNGDYLVKYCKKVIDEKIC